MRGWGFLPMECHKIIYMISYKDIYIYMYIYTHIDMEVS